MNRNTIQASILLLSALLAGCGLLENSNIQNSFKLDFTSPISNIKNLNGNIDSLDYPGGTTFLTYYTFEAIKPVEIRETNDKTGL